MKILGLAGSLRRNSFNKALLRTAAEMAPAGVTLEVFDLAPIPLYDDDLFQAGLPTAVAQFRQAIAAADAVLIATPEYNYSIPGMLKNAIDWASRPPDQPFDGKPLAIMGASPSRLGTARAQYHLRQCFVYLNARVLNRPELMISEAHKLVDGEGRIGDPATRERIGALVAALAA